MLKTQQQINQNKQILKNIIDDHQIKNNIKHTVPLYHEAKQNMSATMEIESKQKNMPELDIKKKSALNKFYGRVIFQLFFL